MTFTPLDYYLLSVGWAVLVVFGTILVEYFDGFQFGNGWLAFPLALIVAFTTVANMLAVAFCNIYIWRSMSSANNKQPVEHT